MKFEDLEYRKQTERNRDSPQALPDDYYEKLVAYLDDPALDEEESQTAEELAGGLVDRRLGKILKAVSFEAADMPADTSQLTPEEEELFHDLVQRMERFRLEVLAPSGADNDGE